MPTDCPDCGVAPGQPHQRLCDVTRCQICGEQQLSCPHPEPETEPLWLGISPGEAECIEYGWFARFDPGKPGWISCEPDAPGATPDLNRLHAEATWNGQRWVKP